MAMLTSRGTRTPLARARLAACVFAVVASGSCALQMDHTLSDLQLASGYGAVSVLCCGFLVAYLRGRGSWWEVAAAAPLILLVEQSLRVKPATVAVAMSVIAAHSLYGSDRMVAARGAAMLAAFPVALRLPQGDAIAQDPLNVISPMAVIAVFAILVRSMYRALKYQQDAGERQSLLAHTGRSLLGVTDAAIVRTSFDRAISALCQMTPGSAILMTQDLGDQDLVRFASQRCQDLQGTMIDPVPDSLLGDGELISIDPAEWQVGHEAFGPGRHLSAMRIGADGDEKLVVSSPRALTMELRDVLSTMTTQITQAELACRAHADLVTLAHHDSLTAISNRPAFFQQLINAVESAVGEEDQLGLLMIDLDDFKTVNDTFGHAAGDQVLIAIAERMTYVAGEAGVAARFGGDEFALLVTDVDGAVTVTRLAEALRGRLIEPVAWEGHQLQVGASIGVMIGVPGATAGDLMRCADIAMYSAKALGKNQVVQFQDQDHGTIAHLRLLRSTPRTG